MEQTGRLFGSRINPWAGGRPGGETLMPLLRQVMRLLRQAALLSLLTVPGWSTILYNNGAINGTIAAHPINQSIEVTDSFVISSISTVMQVSGIGLWVDSSGSPDSPDIPEELSWVVSTSPDGGGTVEGSASGVSLSTSFFGTVFSDYTIYSASFSVPSLTLAAGTYFLELFNAISADSGDVYWDQNNGPSTADQDGTTSPSEAFQIDGASGVPEPATVGTLAAGLGFLAWLYGRRKRA